MFLVTALLYPCVLAALCTGAGLLVDRCCGSVFLPISLLPVVGVATLIAVSQGTTYLAALAPATPYVLVAVALVGFVCAPARTRALARRCLRRPAMVLVPVLAYALALAPVLLAGRPSFSSYMTLADSAVHMLGAGYLIEHGQNYSHHLHLDLHNSYGQFVRDYYGTSYPSGADTLFGGSALLLPDSGPLLIWAFQPFTAFVLATATGPAWLLARRLRLRGAFAALAALTAVLPALVYAYVLFGSVKEIVALSLILTLGALVALHRRWLVGPPVRALPFALVLAGGVSTLGVAFGAWALATVAVLAVALVAERRALLSSTLALLGVAAIVLILAAWSTWSELSGSLQVASNIASTGNSGNLHTPLRAIQVFGVWLHGSYKLAPTGAALVATHALIVLVFVLAALGGVQLLRARAYVLAGWFASMLLTWLVVSELVTTWANAKTLMLTSPVAVLMAWGGVAALLDLSRPRSSRSARSPSPARERSRSWPRSLARPVAALLALVLAGGVLASDAMQYHVSDLAPTARYEQLASLNARFAGRGPALFTDFDEYSLYLLHDLDVGGPDFVYPPPALAATAGGYGDPVDLDRAPPTALLAYPLIVTRRDPSASRPPAAYRLLWQGAYYQVWGRVPGAPAARAHVALTGAAPAVQCARIGRLARAGAARVALARGREDAHATAATAAAAATTTTTPLAAVVAARNADVTTGARLVAAAAPTLVQIGLAGAAHPAGWGHERAGLVMSRPGRLTTTFEIPEPGRWDIWVQGQIMPTVEVRVDGRRVASIAGQLDGNSLVPNTVPPLPVQLAAGPHRLTVTRPGGEALAPGSGGMAVLDAIFLTPAADGGEGRLETAPAADWRALCARPHQWVELVADGARA